MLKFSGSENLHKIVVLNPKGGSGKTTLAFNLAGYIASTGRKVALIDMDPQGSSTRWMQNRPPELPHVEGISVIVGSLDASGNQLIMVPEYIDYAVIDAPGGVARKQLIDYTCGAHATLIPVLPSDLDVHAASRLISDLLLVAQVSRRNGRFGVVANRVKARTVAYRQLTGFLNRLSIPVVGIFRDSQNYAWAASNGLCIHEMQASRVSKDLAQWETVTHWLERRLVTPLTERDFLRPAQTETITQKTWRKPRTTILMPAAAVMLLFVMSLWWWIVPRDMNSTTLAAPTESSVIFEAKSSENGEAVLSDKAMRINVDAADKLQQKWQLTGIILRADGGSIMILNDRYDRTTRHVSAEDRLDGWTITEAGSKHAVFSMKGEEVRLVLNDEAPQ